MMIKKILLLIFIAINSSYAQNAPLLNFIKTVDWSFMGDKTTFSLDLCNCDITDGGNGAGLRATIAEPIGIIEFTNSDYQRKKCTN